MIFCLIFFALFCSLVMWICKSAFSWYATFGNSVNLIINTIGFIIMIITISYTTISLAEILENLKAPRVLGSVLLTCGQEMQELKPLTPGLVFDNCLLHCRFLEHRIYQHEFLIFIHIFSFYVIFIYTHGQRLSNCSVSYHQQMILSVIHTVHFRLFKNPLK